MPAQLGDERATPILSGIWSHAVALISLGLLPWWPHGAGVGVLVMAGVTPGSPATA
jgi:hypothetical protein